MKRVGNTKAMSFVTARGKDSEGPSYVESEISVTAQIPLSMLQAPDDPDLQYRALVQLLVAKGVITEVELTEMLIKLKSSGG